MATLAVAAVTISSAWAGVEAHADQSDLLGKAASALAVPSGYQVVQVRGGASLTDSLRAAVKTAGTAARPRLVVLPPGDLKLKLPVYPANHVYLVAAPETTVTWTGSGAQMVRFEKVTGGVYGGVWDGDKRGSAHVFNATSAQVRFAKLTARNAGANGIVAYKGATLALKDVKASGNAKDGVNTTDTKLTAAGLKVSSNKRNGLYVNKSNAVITNSTFSTNKLNGIVGYAGSTATLQDATTTANHRDGVYVTERTKLTATRLQATLNRRSGVQLADKATVVIKSSALDDNGQAVTGSTTDKIGHGLGVGKSAKATVSASTISGNKVCGVSLTSTGSVSVKDSTIASNGRHGVGTRGSVTGTFTGTKIVKNKYNGILATGSGTKITLTGSTVSASKKFGISVPSKGAVVLKRSTVSGSGSSNISVSGGGKLTLKEDNTISSGKGDGVAVTGKGQVKVTVKGNAITSNKGNGLRVSGSGTKGRIEKAVMVRGNEKIGILVHVKGRLETVKNEVSGGKKKSVVTKSGGKVVKL